MMEMANEALASGDLARAIDGSGAIDDTAGLESGADARPVARALRGTKTGSKRSPTNAEEQLALISSISTLGFWNWTAAADRVWADAHARRILGFDEFQRLTRATLLAAVHPADRAAVVHALSAPARRDNMVEMELRVVGRGDEICWIIVKACAYFDAVGAVRKVAGYVVDEGQRKKAEATSLKQQQQITHLTRVAMLGELSGALAHELQQPLTAILCNAQAAQIIAAKPQVNLASLREILSDIVNDDKHAGQIIQHLRSLLMRGEMQSQVVEIGELLRNVLTLANSTLSERNVRFETHIDQSIPAVCCDRVEIQQVLLNLILNACESMSNNAASDRRIRVVAALEEDGCTVRTSVLDCGLGIDAEQLERVFDPFFTTKKRGLGLGLAVCQSIISAHTGRLWATNNSDRGAAFHFTLPVSRERTMNGERE
jgi:C4-dicarboxylate-specific signal transduction histidine kinase